MKVNDRGIHNEIYDNCNYFENKKLNEITEGKSLEDFRFFAPCERREFVGVFGIDVYGDGQDLVECKFENPQYGTIDIVPIDYPNHRKRNTYISDVYSMFGLEHPEMVCFFRKENERQHVIYINEREYITPTVYFVHVGQIISE